MGRSARGDLFASDEIALVHVTNRVVRRCFLMGLDPLTGKNYDHRKDWIERELERVAAHFGIDLLSFSILSNHFHLILRSRPDVVTTWDDREIARRWLMLCPKRKHKDGSAKEPTDKELNSITSDKAKVKQLRSRLSDISWWMRLLSQRIAQRANREDGECGKFWESRYRAVRLIDDESLLACSAYVDLNPIRAAIAETLEMSHHTSVQRRIEALHASLSLGLDMVTSGQRRPADAFLAPLEIDEKRDPLGPQPNASRWRCSDKGFLPMPLAAYLELLDWTARRLVPGKPGATPANTPPILERMKIQPEVWYALVTQFGQLFSAVAGKPDRVDAMNSRQRGSRFYVNQATRELLKT